jgi:glycerate kinase
MRIVIAPQGFKGTLNGTEAVDAIASGVLHVLPDATLVRLPMADGGHGTLDALLGATAGERFSARVTGPMGTTVDAAWGVTGGGGPIAVVEMAQASGLTLVPENERDPMLATTYGTGQLLAAVLRAGHRRIIVGVGGSATNDGGAGAAQALGVGLTDGDGNAISFGAQGLLQLAHVSLAARHPTVAGARIQVATDVSNSLVGPEGAAMTYGPQKGALPHTLPLLEAALANMADVAKRDLRIALHGMPGAGAAGGLAAGLVAFLGAKLLWGAEVVADTVGLDAALDGADLAITGEGRIDWQTVYNKAPIEVARRAARKKIPVLAIGGSLGRDAESVLAHGVTMLEGCVEPDEAVPTTVNEASAALTAAAERATHRWLETHAR